MITTLIAVSVVIAFLFAFSFLLDREEHISRIIRLFLVLFAITLLILVPKSAIDSNEVCEILPDRVNETFRYGWNYSSYHWDYMGSPLSNPSTTNADYMRLFHRYTDTDYALVCFDRDENTAVVLFNAIMWFLRIMWFAIIIYFIYELMSNYKSIISDAQQLFRGRYR